MSAPLPKTKRTLKRLRQQLKPGDTVWTVREQATWMCPGLPDAMSWSHKATRKCWLTGELMFGTTCLSELVDEGVYLSQPRGYHPIDKPLPQVAAPNPDLNEWEKAEKWRREAARKAGVR